MAPVGVYLEISDKRSFACAYDWPGWCRSGKTEDSALDALAAYASRYAPVAKAAGIEYDPGWGRNLRLIERLEGDATTAFGAPSVVTSRDLDEPGDLDRERLLVLVAAAWEVFDQIVAASPEELRKGPRGGGRDRTALVRHVLGAEAGYSRLLGLRLGEPDPSASEAIAAHRQGLLDGLRGADATRRRDQGKRRWPMRYGARRIAWHSLDHAWEMQDRSLT